MPNENDKRWLNALRNALAGNPEDFETSFNNLQTALAQAPRNIKEELRKCIMPHENYEILLNSLKASYQALRKEYLDQDGRAVSRQNRNRITYSLTLTNEARQELAEALKFQNPNNLEYRDRLAQNLFRIRFTYVYAYGYMKMFLDLMDAQDRRLRADQKRPPIKILSIGCGNGVDCWAVHEAKRINGQNRYIEYLGVDKFSWAEQYRLDPRHDSYKTEDIVEYLGNLENHRLEQNTIVFAKVLNELEDDEIDPRYGVPYFQQLCKVFEEIDFMYPDRDPGTWRYSKFVSFLFFLRTKEVKNQDDTGTGEYIFYEDDEEKMNRLITAMGTNRNGYHFEQAETPVTFLVGQERPDGTTEQSNTIQRIDENFHYIYKRFLDKQSPIGSYIDHLTKKPAEPTEHEIRSPMEYTHNIGYRIVTFRRVAEGRT